jgi:hypothetical protein
MNDDDIPVKTADGIAEIKTRGHRLISKVRTVLLLVDGVKSIAELKKLMPASGTGVQALEILSDKGLIHFPQRRDKPASPAVPEDTSIIEYPSPVLDAPVRLPADAATMEEPASVPSSTPRHTAAEQAAWQPEASADASALSKRRTPKQMVVLIARAHLANALDEHLGFDGYLLRQDVVDCTSREQLESLFSKVEGSLIVPLGNTGAARVIEHARSLFDTHRPGQRLPP